MQKVNKYYSQIGQDKYYIENLINHKMNGYFIDVGANNGINLSNTYVLEKDYSWKGLCIEVDDKLFVELEQNRTCKVVNECVYSTSGIVKTLQVPLVNEIPEGNKLSKGRAIQNLINIPGDDKVKAYVKVQDLTDQEYINNNFIIIF